MIKYPKMVVGEAIGVFLITFAGCGVPATPARSLDPALLSGNTDMLWIYLAMPLSTFGLNESGVGKVVAGSRGPA